MGSSMESDSRIPGAVVVVGASPVTCDLAEAPDTEPRRCCSAASCSDDSLHSFFHADGSELEDRAANGVSENAVVENGVVPGSWEASSGTVEANAWLVLSMVRKKL